MTNEIEDMKRLLADIEAMKAEGADDDAVSAKVAEFNRASEQAEQKHLTRAMHEAWAEYEPFAAERARLRHERDEAAARYREYSAAEYTPARRRLGVRVAELRDAGLPLRVVGEVSGFTDGGAAGIEKIGRAARAGGQDD